MSHPDQWSWVEWQGQGAPSASAAAPPASALPPLPPAARVNSVDSNASHVNRVAALQRAAPVTGAASSAAPGRKDASGRTVRAMQSIDEETDVVMSEGSNTLLYVLLGLLVVSLLAYAYLVYRARKRNTDNEKAVKAAQASADSREAQPPPLAPAAKTPSSPAPAPAPLQTVSQAKRGGRVMFHAKGAPPAPDAPATQDAAAPPQEVARQQMVQYARTVAQTVQNLSAGGADTALYDSMAAVQGRLQDMDPQTLLLWIRKHEDVAKRMAQNHEAARHAAPEQHSSHARVTAMEEIPDDVQEDAVEQPPAEQEHDADAHDIDAEASGPVSPSEDMEAVE